MNAPAANVTQINLTETGMSAIGKGMRLHEIRQAIPELEAACNHAIDAAETFTDLCKLVGLKAGTDPGVVKSFISARCKDAIARTAMRAEQLQILFDECD